MNQAALFDAPDDRKAWQRNPHELARTEDPMTSHAAARALSGKAGTMRRRLLETFAHENHTAESASNAAGYFPADGAWKRVSDLQVAGLIAPTGLTRIASTGRAQRVLGITIAGIEALRH